MAQVLKQEDTLQSQQATLSTENDVLEYAVYLELAAGALTGLYGLYSYVSSGSYGILVLGVALLVLGISHYVKRQENEDDIGKIQSGRSGEQFVSDLLEEDLPDNFYVINDLDVSDGRRTAQNDHLVLSPGGIFLVETKAYAGTLSGAAEDEHWTQTRDNGTKTLTNPIQQSEYHRDVLEGHLDRNDLPYAPEDLHMFVAMVNKSCEWTIDGEDDIVDYAWKLPGRLKKIGSQTIYSRDDLVAFLNSVDIEPPAQDGSESASTPSETEASAESEEWWIYRDGDVSEDTYTKNELKKRNLSPDTMVCARGSDEWVPLTDTEDLRALVNEK